MFLLKNVLGHYIWSHSFSFGQEFKKLDMHFIKGPLQSAAKWSLTAVQVETVL